MVGRDGSLPVLRFTHNSVCLIQRFLRNYETEGSKRANARQTYCSSDTSEELIVTDFHISYNFKLNTCADMQQNKKMQRPHVTLVICSELCINVQKLLVWREFTLLNK